MLAYFDRTGQDCYLETLDEKNVSLYEHFGFKLMESVKLPDSQLTLYAMLKKASDKNRYGGIKTTAVHIAAKTV